MKKITTILILSLSMAVFGQAPSENRNSQENCDAAVESTSIGGGRQCSANNDWTIAVDVVVPADKNLTLNSITPSFGIEPGTTVTSVLVTVYNNANGVPGNAIGSSQTITPSSSTYKGSQFGMDFSEVLLELTPVSLSGSAGSEAHYWIAMQITTSNDSDGYIEHTSESAIGLPLAFSSGAGFIIPDETKEGVYSLTADCEPMSGNVFPAPYCGPIVFGTVEPITKVEIAGIDNTSSAIVDGSPAHEDFTSISGEMEQGNTYSISIEGNTVGDYTNQVVVFIDWNQNESLDDEGEVYVIGSGLLNTTGTDGVNVTDTIEVPADAVLGTTRMRVKKTFEGPHLNPCDSGANWGQTEDYSIEVTENLGVTENNAFAGFSFYPNPTSDVVHLKATSSIETASLYNLLGQEVLSVNMNTTSSELNLSGLTSGTYILKVSVNGEVGTYKLLKK
ncbi:T9SS type A sorting domain-containing protein [Aequorivita marina]|uniref:T9SS type A sorting domain-containing protein n=1 Tax=Aequorivita marina TaxID=3073654 RepID=UPI00287629D8|nr:T9SS type A sorting domain-containing protein [Aequorivita sp. S2608]MDS1296991.1 T9SS type A sorting domain-containing protein [Aequorivita sp. S2608]